MKTYEKYKPSGIEWIGEIPEHWNIKRVKFNTYVKGRVGWHGLKADEFSTTESVYCVTGTDFFKGKVNWDGCYRITESRYDEDPYIQLKENDLLITKDGTIGKLAIVENLPDKATLNSGVFVVRPENDEYLTKFMYWAFQSNVFNEYVDYTSKGSTIIHLYQNVFVDLPFLLPTIHEQTAIADYLDEKTVEIDKLIANKERLIELLKEERTAIINKAVTRGINADAKLKPSGIDWLGDIPEHWEIKRLKLISPKILVGLVINPSTYFDPKGTIPMLTGKNVSPNTINPKTANLITEKSNKLLYKTIVEENDIVVVRVGYPGVAAVVRKDVSGSNCASMMIVRKGNFNSDFLCNCFNSKVGKSQVEIVEYGAAQRQFNISHAIDFQFPVPPIEEQKEIVEFIESKTNEIDSTISKIEKEIELIKEYRTALISEVVTGKIKVIDN